MAEVSRITALWSGFAGAPGYSKFSFMPLADAAARNSAGASVRTFFAGLATYLPNGTSIAVQPAVDNLDTVTGALLGTSTMTSIPAPVTSIAAAANYAGGSGFVVTWLTGSVFAGRRVKGRTFIVPSVGCYETDGTLVSSVISAAMTAGGDLIAGVGNDFAVWNREWSETEPKVPLSGIVTPVTAVSVRDIASQLRSRRT